MGRGVSLPALTAATAPLYVSGYHIAEGVSVPFTRLRSRLAR